MNLNFTAKSRYQISSRCGCVLHINKSLMRWGAGAWHASLSPAQAHLSQKRRLSLSLTLGISQTKISLRPERSGVCASRECKAGASASSGGEKASGAARSARPAAGRAQCLRVHIDRRRKSHVARRRGRRRRRPPAASSASVTRARGRGLSPGVARMSPAAGQWGRGDTGGCA